MFLIVISARLEATGDIILKKWAIDGKNIALIFGIAVYFVATLLWAFSLKYEFLSKAISILTVLNLVIVVLVGVLYFKEDLSMVNKIGIALGIISIILIER